MWGKALTLVKFLRIVAIELDEFSTCFTYVRHLAMDDANVPPWRLISLGLGGSPCKHVFQNTPTVTSMHHFFYHGRIISTLFHGVCVLWLAMATSMHGDGEELGLRRIATCQKRVKGWETAA